MQVRSIEFQENFRSVTVEASRQQNVLQPVDGEAAARIANAGGGIALAVVDAHHQVVQRSGVSGRSKNFTWTTKPMAASEAKTITNMGGSLCCAASDRRSPQAL